MQWYRSTPQAWIGSSKDPQQTVDLSVSLDLLRGPKEEDLITTKDHLFSVPGVQWISPYAIICRYTFLILVVTPHGDDGKNVGSLAHQNFKHLQLNSKY